MHPLIKELITRGPVVTDGAWGTELQARGLASGDVTNDISALVADPNVSIHEGKVFSCELRPGRRSAPAAELQQLFSGGHDAPLRVAASAPRAR